MSQFNQYSMYSYMAGDFKSATDGKVLVDLKKLGSLKKYDEILDFITSTFGEIGEGKELEYPNNVKVQIDKIDDLIIVLATQNGERIFGTSWLPPDEE